MQELCKIGFGGGCHWCTEAVFQKIKGVEQVKQGFMRSTTPHDSWSEAVEVTYDPNIISLNELCGVHLVTHASTSEHKMRGKYRSAVYTFNERDLQNAQDYIAQAGLEAEQSFVTLTLPYQGFKSSDQRFHNYYEQDTQRPFCKTYIDPKLAKLRRRFVSLLKPDA